MFPALIGNIGTPEILVILVIALLLFGRRLPEVGRSLGKGIVEFKKGIRGIEDDIREETEEPSRKVERLPRSTSGRSGTGEAVDLDQKSASKTEAGPAPAEYRSSDPKRSDA